MNSATRSLSSPYYAAKVHNTTSISQRLPMHKCLRMNVLLNRNIVIFETGQIEIEKQQTTFVYKSFLDSRKNKLLPSETHLIVIFLVYLNCLNFFFVFKLIFFHPK